MKWPWKRKERDPEDPVAMAVLARLREEDVLEVPMDQPSFVGVGDHFTATLASYEFKFVAVKAGKIKAIRFRLSCPPELVYD